MRILFPGALINKCSVCCHKLQARVRLSRTSIVLHASCGDVMAAGTSAVYSNMTQHVGFREALKLYEKKRNVGAF